MPGPAGDDHDDLDDEHEDEHDGSEPLGSPPHPLDRIWRHPSELPARPTVARAAGPRRDFGQFWLALTAASAGAVATLVILAAFGVFDDTAAQAPRAEHLQRDDAAVAKLAADIAPSIVTVAVLAPDGARRGSGVCVRHSGDILTSDRLVRGATHVTVTTHDGTAQSAKVLGRDAATDLALLHVDAGLQAAPVAQELLHAGDTVLAVGTSSTGGKDPWIGNGIVASVDGVVAQLGGPSMDGLIATGASPGKAGMGGALLNRLGTVAGILLAPVVGDGSTYAVPIAFAAEVADELGTHGTAVHGWLGMQGTDTGGVPTVTGMTRNGPAERAGIRAGDEVVAVGGRSVTTMGEVTAAARRYEPRDTVSIKVRRADALVNVEVKMGTAPANAAYMGA